MLKAIVPVETESSSLSAVFTQLAESDVGRFTIFFRRLRETYPYEAIRRSLEYLATHAIDTPGRQMAIWLSSKDLYVPVLLDPEFLPLDRALPAATIMREADREFFAKLSRLSNAGNSALIVRALSVLESLGDLTLLIPWLRLMTKHGDEHIESKAVKVLCMVRCNKELVERQLQSTNGRARANAVEAMWNAQTGGAVVLFRSVLDDPHPRVVVNALVGLYLHEDAGAFEQIVALGEHSSAAFRAAGAWALGEIRDRRGLATLEALADDTAITVRKGAANALNRFRALEADELERMPLARQ